MGFSSVTSPFLHLASVCCADNASVCTGQCIHFVMKVQQTKYSKKAQTAVGAKQWCSTCKALQIMNEKMDFQKKHGCPPA